MLSIPSGTPSPEEVALYQQRVGRFAFVLGVLGLAFMIFRVVLLLTIDSEIFEPSMWLHGLAVAVMLWTWLLTRGGTKSYRFVGAVETVGLVGSSAAYAAMGAYIPLFASPHMIMLATLSYSLMARAAYVPSTARRTLMLGIAIWVPYVVTVYVAFLRADADEIEHMFPGGTAGVFAIVQAATSTMWWTITTVLATGITQIVYGLRREARDVKRLGQYTLEEKLGEGGMGAVYRASHAMLRRPTAVKLILPERTGEAALKRFEKEVQLTAGLTHPNTITIYDYGRTPDGVFYYAMELLDGGTLEDVVAIDGAQPAARVRRILSQMASALYEAHSVGLIHRDVKPANVILTRRGGQEDVAKVVDFGLVKDLSRDVAISATAHDRLTGTPQYMSPESITKPDAVDARSDIYAVGAVGYFLLTGTHVFTGATIVEVCTHHLHTAPETPSQRLGQPVPADLERLVLECLAKSPEARPKDARELAQRLAACDVGEWSDEDAKSWWQMHDARLKARHSAVALGTTRTIDVDVFRRGVGRG